MCNPEGVIKDPLLLFGKVAHVVVAAGFLSLTEWSFPIDQRHITKIKYIEYVIK